MSLRERAFTPDENGDVLQPQNGSTAAAASGQSYPRHSAQSHSTASLSSRDGQSPRHSGATNPLKALKDRFFNSRDKENKRHEQLMTTEGSIRKPVWDGISKDNLPHIRLKYVGQLSELVKHNQLQVSTLEGLYHDMNDMLDDETTRDPVLRLMTDVTATQQQQVGLGLRQQFFKRIREIGCEENTLKWLRALSLNGERIDGFERDMDFMLADWVNKHLFDRNPILAMELLELCNQLIQRNSAYICAAALTDIVQSVCVIGCRISSHPKQPHDPSTQELVQKCLDLIDTVLRFSDIPRNLVLYMIPVICIQVCSSTFREKSWHLTKILLTSQMGHRTRKSIQSLLEDCYPMTLGLDQDVYNLMIRGAVFCLANAVWGHQKIENMSCSPANIIPSFTKVISRSPDICIDVFTATKRLVQKHGSDLQPLVWLKLLDLFNAALEHFRKYPEFNSKCASMLKVQLALTEQYHKENQFSASTEKLFDFIERAVDFYPDSPAGHLIEYKFSRITPQMPNFIEAAAALVQRYAHPKQHQDRRKKAVQCMSSFFIRYRMLYETELADKLVLPVVRNITQEKNPAVQYQLILALFDIARHVSFRGQVDLFGCAMQLVKKLMNMAITNPATARMDEATEESSSDRDTLYEFENSFGELTLTLDNLECIVKNMEEVISDRWGQLNLKNLSVMTGILIEHLDVQYKAGWTSDVGSPIRESIVNTLLSIQCCPITNRIQRVTRTDPEPHANLLIKRKHDHNENGFVWSDICRITTEVLKQDNNWGVIKSCLERLGKILENMSFVRTADKQLVNNLCSALVNLYQRAEAKEIEFPCPPERKKSKETMEFPTEENISKYLPPVLAILLNYTSLYHSGDNRNNEICRVLVDCVDSDHLEGLMAIDVAVQLVPDAMASNAFKLLDILKRLEPSSKRAIPLIEFMSDSAEIAEFHRFFNEGHYRTVVDILVPYTDVAKFNAYIVSCIHRILMRWYTQIVPGGAGSNNVRWSVAKYITDRFTETPLDIVMSLEPMRRQYSGDGRTVENPFLLGGDPSTPPPESKVQWNMSRGADKVKEEILQAMQTFFSTGKIDHEVGTASALMQQTPSDKYEEISVDHYFLNNTIISISRLVDKRWKQSLENNEEEVFSADGEPGSPSSPNEFAPSSFDRKDDRRRFASAKEIPRSASVKPPNKALDDLYASGGPHQFSHKTNAKRSIVSFVKMATRHMYGRSNWVMRALDEWPDDFEKSAAIPSSSHSFMSHILNVPGGLTPLLSSKNENEINEFDRGLRVLDNLPGIEHHVAGLLYMAPGQETEGEVFSNIYGSERYNRFVRLLGDTIPLKGCPGGLREGFHGQYTYAYTDSLSAIIYQIATLMPTDPEDSQQNGKKLLIGNNHVTIVFNESGKPYKTGLVSGQFDSVTLEIVPSDPRTVVITVHAKADIACWLAMKRVLLTDEAASRLIRKLVVRSYLSVRVFHSLSKSQCGQAYISSGVERLRKIQAIRDKYSPVSQI